MPINFNKFMEFLVFVFLLVVKFGEKDNDNSKISLWTYVAIITIFFWLIGSVIF